MKSQSTTLLSGIGGGCLTGFCGVVLGAVIGFAVHPTTPQRTIRPNGEENLADRLGNSMDHVDNGTSAVTYVIGGAILGGAIGVIPGIVMGGRSSRRNSIQDADLENRDSSS